MLALGILSACGAKHAATFDIGEATAEGDASALSGEAQALWEERGDTAQLQAALDKYEEVLAVDPGNREALLHLARGYYFLGDAHLSDDEEKKTAWDKSIGYGKKCMGLNEAFRAANESGEADEETAAANLTSEDTECTYWTASALGKWVGLHSLGVKLKNIPTVKAWISRVEELDSSYYFTATDRYWGAYWAAIPSFAGRDLDKSRTYFDKAIEAEPMFFGNRVLVASFWAEKTQDIAEFDKQIAFVLSHCPNTLDGVVPEQEAEQRKAQDLLDRRAELFIDASNVEAPTITAPDCTPAVEEVVEEAPADESQEGAENEGEDVQEAAAEGEGSQEAPDADNSESVTE
jgi:tetratricopeptide (TPR) repeat protein